MSDNYIMLNGKRVDLTEEQLEKLGLNTSNTSEDFKPQFGREYFYINGVGEVIKDTEGHISYDAFRYNVGNYCKNKKLLEQRALHETLDRLLWRFSMQNDGDKIDWKTTSGKYYIEYLCNVQKFGVSYLTHPMVVKYHMVYFNSVKIAQRAIDEIVLPFIKEHTDFVW